MKLVRGVKSGLKQSVQIFENPEDLVTIFFSMQGIE